MEESSTELQKRIERYKEYVEKSVAQGDDHKLLQTIRKLNKLPITVSHLQDTGVGRTINSLRKLEGSIGKESRDLVQKWRNMVMVEEDNSEETENDIHSSEETSVKEKSHSSKNNNEENHREDKSSKESRHDKYDKPERKDESSKRNKYDSDKYNKYDKNDKNDKYDKNDRSNNEKNHNHKHDKNSANSSHSHSDDNKKHKNKEKKSEEKEKDKIREKEKNKDRDKDLKQKEKDKDKEREKDRDKDRHNDKKRKREESLSREKKHRYESSDENCSENEDYEENNYSSHKQNSASHSSEKKEKLSSDKYKSSKSDKKEKESSHHNSKNSNKSSSNSSSSSSSKNNSNNIGGSTSSTSSSKTSHDSSKDKSSRDKKSESNSNSKNSDSTNISSSNSNKKEVKFKTPSKSSSNSKLKKDKDENSDEEGICSSSGASFAEALGMMESVPTIRSVKKKEKTKPASPIPSTSKEKPSSTKPSSYSSSSSSHTSSNNKADSPLSTSPALLTSNVKLEPLDLNISSELPQITTNYKPLPTTFDLDAFNKYGLKSDMTEEEALSRVISSKTQRTKVYSGNKTWRYVPSLFNLCVKILQENIDSLEYTGGVPYSILKPVLERATAEQLFNAEHYNPYLIDDTDELWECICKKQFRGKIPGEMESWRDMYLRCVDEREVKLRSLTATIKQSQEIKKAPVRQTKLAYVDTVAKPPRAVAKKQAKYGTGSSNNTPLITPSARLNAVAAPKSNNSITVPAPVQRVSHSGAVMKPKKAPLMQKALAAIKSRFRR